MYRILLVEDDDHERRQRLETLLERYGRRARESASQTKSAEQSAFDLARGSSDSGPRLPGYRAPGNGWHEGRTRSSEPLASMCRSSLSRTSRSMRFRDTPSPPSISS
jgi:hypothetical protein